MYTIDPRVIEDISVAEANWIYNRRAFFTLDLNQINYISALKRSSLDTSERMPLTLSRTRIKHYSGDVIFLEEYNYIVGNLFPPEDIRHIVNRPDTPRPRPVSLSRPSAFATYNFDTTVAPSIPNATENTEEDVEDLSTILNGCRLWYRNCYFIKEDEVCLTYDFEYGSDNTIKIIYYKLNSRGEPFKKVEATYDKNTILFKNPKMGYVNNFVTSIFLEREHKKTSSNKYKRGFESTLVKYSVTSKKELEHLDVAIPSLNSYLNNIFFREYPSYQEALENVINFRLLSQAFSNTLCIKLDRLYNRFLLLKNNWVIAEFDQKNNIWLMLINTFNHNLKELNIPFQPREN